jgi:tetratricopeptide (TPR) repeat protein
MDQGKLKSAAVHLDSLRTISPFYAAFRSMSLAHLSGNMPAARRVSDSLLRSGPDARRRGAWEAARGIAYLDGRLRAAEALHAEENASARDRGRRDQEVLAAMLAVAARGATPEVAARADSVVARIRFDELPMIDRPYLLAAALLARVGKPDKARAMVGRYRAEVTDTSIKRVNVDEYHSVLGEIALASGKPREALDEFRRGDVGFDGAPANECAACLPFDLARAYDAAGKPDSAAVMFEAYLSTPAWYKIFADMDGVRVPAIRERLGQLYEGMGNTTKAIENYRAFVELWKNADPELQPRVADAKRRLARLTKPELPRR